MSSEVEVKPVVEVAAAATAVAEEVADIFPDAALEAAAVASLPASEESSLEDEESKPDESVSATSHDGDIRASMNKWVETIDKIQYYFRADEFDEDRSFNFFKDSNGNTLKIVEFYIGNTPYLNINDEFVIARKEFSSVITVTGLNNDSSSVKFPSSIYFAASVPVTLMAEALMVLGDEADSDSESEDSEESESESEVEVEPQPQPQVKPAMNESQQSVVNFLISFSLVVLLLKLFGGAMMIINKK